MKEIRLVACLAGLILASCSQDQNKAAGAVDAPTSVTQTDTGYVESINQWHAAREQDLQQETGWLALSGLYWLEPGVNTFGSAAGNDVIFPEGKINARAGSFILEGDTVRLQVKEKTDVRLGGKPVQQEALVYTSSMAHAPEMQHGPLKWLVIRRGDKYGIRLWDADRAARKSFTGITRYPVQPEWKLEARLEQNPLPKQIPITNVLGQTLQEPSPGAVVFSLNGQQHRLDALEEGEELFIIFADKTNGTDTYGSGRYLYMPRPGADGKTVIDFNKAYNPPCAFTDFATCPLPPRQNFLPVAVTAGEKNYAVGK
ncbi:DUF1684 domain-containing protein [Pontibacter akesuensis]|uniref:DUF1684 domain-containing protein n=1 Tax=Pontibacter akesuensis TaxID=388950 RepID=A0A1I7K325_9BACT|nr:DUF1684 domain-containing protein [Pontibacter akesuensis]GHA75492.1 hypothetical protein GCM10007389_31710 [Pontibacter akesuensis]SFU91775.1 hypothetical protein SAMN04487941_3332 [Pontibacter akesuensis]